MPQAPSAQPVGQQAPTPAGMLAQPMGTKTTRDGPVDTQLVERAGGYRREYIRARALEEAFSALWIPKTNSNNTVNVPTLSPMKLS